MMKTLSIDLETRSAVDIGKTGVYRYAEDLYFDILLFGVSIDGGPVTVYDLASGEQLPVSILDALCDDEVIKYAYNASFERVCLSYWLIKKYPEQIKTHYDFEANGGFLNPTAWRCTMVWAAYNGLPLSLAQVGAALGLEQQKMTEGRALIRYFCTPTSSQAPDRLASLQAGKLAPSAARPFSEKTRSAGLFSDIEPKRFHTPEDDPEKWALFKAYNKRDVEVEMAIQERLRK